MVQWADLTALYDRFASLGSSPREFDTAIEEVGAAVAGVAAHTPSDG